MPQTNLQGLRVLALETRRATEIAKLIRTYGGEPLVAPALREIPLESNHSALEFAGSVMRDEVDMVIFLTGVGVRALLNIVELRYGREEFLSRLRKAKIASRGPKPSAVLREFNVPVSVTAPEPCTWRELIGAIDAKYGSSLSGLRVAVQEYGAANPELVDALIAADATVTRVPVYQWALPEDLQPLRESVIAIAQQQIDVILFLNAAQIIHLFLIAGQMGLTEQLHNGLRSTLVISIGPSTTEELHRHSIAPDFEPSHPKMGFLVNEVAQCATRLLEEKRAAQTQATSPRHALSISTASSPIATLDSVPSTVPRAFRDASVADHPGMVFLHEIGSRMAADDQFHTVLQRIVEFVSSVVNCDSCFLYVLERDELVLRASKNPHSDLVDHLGLRLGQGITGWVAEHREPVAIASQALRDPRFKRFKDLPEDLFEAFLSVPILCRGKLVGVINLQHREPYHHTAQEIRLISMTGFLVGAEIERARLESENLDLTDRLESRKHIDRAKGILQRDFSMNEEEAYRMMQQESRQRRKSMREIAEAILLNEDLRRKRLQGTS